MMDNPKYTAIIAIANIDETTVQEAKRLFMSYRNTDVITSGSFDDDVWGVTDEYANYNLNFVIKPDAFDSSGCFLQMELEEFKTYLKTYIMCQMGSLSIRTLQAIILEIKRTIVQPVDSLENFSEGCNLEFMHRVSEFFSTLPPTGREDRLTQYLDKLDMISDNLYSQTSSGQRTLAAFESYFRFGEILERFWVESDDISEKLFYFPVWMWWHVSGVLPMRPRCLVLTPRNCLSTSNGVTFLTVRKNAIKGSNKTKAYKIEGDYKRYKYQIPESLAAEIRWYQENTKDLYATALQTLFIPDPHYAKWGRCRPYTSRYFTYVNLTTCLRYFFEQIVQDRYGYHIIHDRNTKFLNDNEIHYLHLGDTRHLALINLIAEGATPMVAMMLAGHDNPNMSSHYYSNIATLIECKTYRQYKKLINGKQVYSLSTPTTQLKVSNFTILDDNSRCYSPKVLSGDYSDCCKVSGPAGELGFCPNCTYHRDNGKPFSHSNDIYRNRIESECANLEKIVRMVRSGRGDNEDIVQALLRLKDTEYSYQQYMLEEMEKKNGEK